ncbi:MAG TPA: hypothetical protein VNS31_00920 [Ramlibacter sp.]|jgi:hypothetical protein|nr:hypothetical protein [Ramlibacter sp.]
MAGTPPLLGFLQLRQLASAAARVACPACAALVCPGWETLSATYDRANLRRVGTLRDPAIDEPTLQEFHPSGTNAWAVDAPIAPAFFPYNRCDVWQCVRCSRPLLRYTEYGGYYEEERIRDLDARLLVDASP